MDRYEWKQKQKQDRARRVSRIQKSALVTAGCALGYEYWMFDQRVFLNLEKHQVMSRVDNLIILEVTRLAVGKVDDSLPIDGPLNPSRYNALMMWFRTAKRSDVPALVESKAKEIIDTWWPIFEFVYSQMEAGRDVSNFEIRRLALQENLKTFEQLTDSR
jgi:hypothetical protein